MADDYELVSKKELEELRKEVAQLKQQPLADFRSSVTLIEAMDKLAGQVARLVSIFEHANKELYEEYSQGYHDDGAKLSKVIQQNEKIARGVLAVADLVQKGPAAPKKKVDGAYPLQDQENPKQEKPKDGRRGLIDEFS